MNMYQHFLNHELRLLWGETAAWPSIFTPLPDAPVMWVGKTTEMAGNFAVVFPSEGLLPSDPPLPVAIGPIDGMNPAFSLALCPEKFFALRDGLRDMPESMAMTSRFWIAHYSTIMSMCVLSLFLVFAKWISCGQHALFHSQSFRGWLLR